MLYQTETLRMLHRFAAFVRTKEPDDTYRFFNSQQCACAQFQRAEGIFENLWACKLYEGGALALLNTLSGMAAHVMRGGKSGKWGDLLELVETEIDNELQALTKGQRG